MVGRGRFPGRINGSDQVSTHETPDSPPLRVETRQDPTIAPLVAAYVNNRPAQATVGTGPRRRRMNIVLIRAATGY